MTITDFARDAFEETCAPRRVLSLFATKWDSHVLHAMHRLFGGTCRPGALQRALPGLSKKMLTQTLRALERDGLIRRDVYRTVPPRVDYSLTELGLALIEPIEWLYDWGRRNAAVLDRLGAARSAKRNASRGAAPAGP